MSLNQITKSHYTALAGGVAVFGLMILLILAYQNYEVVDKGQILPYTSGEIYKIEFFGKFSLYVEPELRPSKDIFTAILLIGVGMISLTFAVSLFGLNNMTPNKIVCLFSMMFAGMTYLAFDELFGVHESVGHNLQFLANIPFVHHPDDVIIALYGLPVLVFAYIFRNEFRASKLSLNGLAATVGFFLIAVISDIFDITLVEEMAELMAGLALITAVMSLGYFYLQQVIAER